LWIWFGFWFLWFSYFGIFDFFFDFFFCIYIFKRCDGLKIKN
jgi:hypothetical protein